MGMYFCSKLRGCAYEVIGCKPIPRREQNVVLNYETIL